MPWFTTDVLCPIHTKKRHKKVTITDERVRDVKRMLFTLASYKTFRHTDSSSGCHSMVITTIIHSRTWTEVPPETVMAEVEVEGVLPGSEVPEKRRARTATVDAIAAATAAMTAPVVRTTAACQALRVWANDFSSENSSSGMPREARRWVRRLPAAPTKHSALMRRGT